MQTSWFRQAAAIPIKDGRVCLVTSSSGRRWVIPKGMIDPGKTAGEAALQEAWEEAGLVGSLHPVPAGTYRYSKFGNEYLVTVFVMHVSEVTDQWPERFLRRREWVDLEEAIARIEEPGLREVLRRTLLEVDSPVFAGDE